jgi:hypothetical protein
LLGLGRAKAAVSDRDGIAWSRPQVAAQAGQYIKYKCKKGECGTCAVRVDGNWIRTCSVSVPHVPEGQSYEVRARVPARAQSAPPLTPTLARRQVFVRGTMLKPTKSSRFFSVKSFFSGFKNNLLGMVGFAKEGPLSKKGKVRAPLTRAAC